MYENPSFTCLGFSKKKEISITLKIFEILSPNLHIRSVQNLQCLVLLSYIRSIKKVNWKKKIIITFLRIYVF